MISILRSIAALCAAAAALLSPGLRQTEALADSPPNIILLLADDQTGPRLAGRSQCQTGVRWSQVSELRRNEEPL